MSVTYKANGPLSGTWLDAIFADDGKTLVKRDIFNFSHDVEQGVVYGLITRTFPSDQGHKKWRFMGYEMGDIMVITFTTTDLLKNPGSYGSITVFRSLETHWQGYYHRPFSAMNDTGIFERVVKNIRIDLKRE